MSVGAQNGKIAEVLVELELLKRGWHVERLDGASKAANGDLIAIRGRKRPVIQVKSALTWDRPSFGHATRFLDSERKFFNHADPVILADVLITVVGGPENPIFHIFPIDEAERLAQDRANEWYETLKRTGEQRSKSFPVSLHLSDPRLTRYRDAWEVLDDDEPR